MRHVYIRGLIGLMWLLAAIVIGVSGDFGMTVLYVLLGGVFLHSSYVAWKKEVENKGGR